MRELIGDTGRTAKHGLFSPGLTAAVTQGTRWNDEVRFCQNRISMLGAEQVLLDIEPEPESC